MAVAVIIPWTADKLRCRLLLVGAISVTALCLKRQMSSFNNKLTCMKTKKAANQEQLQPGTLGQRVFLNDDVKDQFIIGTNFLAHPKVNAILNFREKFLKIQNVKMPLKVVASIKPIPKPRLFLSTSCDNILEKIPLEEQAEIRLAQANKPAITKIFEALQTANTTRQLSVFFTEEGILYHQAKDQRQLVLPTSLVDQMLHQF
uniref:Uncharacterized protein n=1 Tax=Romanomermis culicivorax TaxID=13658 RepID=A0A915JG18_ROMCU